MGEGFGINLQNKGTVSAHNLSLFLPGFDGAVWRITELPKGATPYKEIPIQHDAPIRTRRMEGLTARLVYHDRFGVGYEVVAGLTQEARADSYFNIAAHEMRVVKPTQRFVDLWRLRNRV